MDGAAVPEQRANSAAIGPNRCCAGLSSKGFTLIELTVCIVIVLVLAGLILGVVNRARAKARQSACASNLHQIVTAMRMYAEDNDGRGWWGASQIGYDDKPPRAPGAVGIVEVLAPYVTSHEIWFCPSDPWAGKDLVSTSPWVPHWKTSYAITLSFMYILDYPEEEMAFDAVSSGPRLCHSGGFNVAYGDGRVKWHRDRHHTPPSIIPWP